MSKQAATSTRVQFEENPSYVAAQSCGGGSTEGFTGLDFQPMNEENRACKDCNRASLSSSGNFQFSEGSIGSQFESKHPILSTFLELLADPLLNFVASVALGAFFAHRIWFAAFEALPT